MEPRRLADPGGVQLWLVEDTGTALADAGLQELLSDDERKRASRFKVTSAHRSFVVSRGFLRRILGGALGCRPDSLRFGEGEHGKPFLTGPHVASGLEFNVTHSGSIFLYAMTKARSVGVDVELKKEGLEVEKMARRYFAPGEARRLCELELSKDRLDCFYRCWTRKEAYLKARGTGLTAKLEAFEVTFLPGVPPALVNTEVAGEDPAAWRVFDVPVPDGYVAALVVRGVGA